MIRILIIGIAFCLWSAGIQAQEQKWVVSGKVFDRQTDEAVDFANVLLYSSSDSTLASNTNTQADGSFTIESGKAGNYYLTISFIGYETKQITLQPFTSAQMSIVLGDILLEQSFHQLSEVAVTAQRRQIVYQLDKRVIEASGYISAMGGTAVDILEQTPSIRVSAEGELTFRGS